MRVRLINFDDGSVYEHPTYAGNVEFFSRYRTRTADNNRRCPSVKKKKTIVSTLSSSSPPFTYCSDPSTGDRLIFLVYDVAVIAEYGGNVIKITCRAGTTYRTRTTRRGRCVFYARLCVYGIIMLWKPFYVNDSNRTKKKTPDYPRYYSFFGLGTKAPRSIRTRAPFTYVMVSRNNSAAPSRSFRLRRAVYFPPCLPRYTHLKPAHVSRIPGVFQTVLVALQEKLQEKSAKRKTAKTIRLVLFGERDPPTTGISAFAAPFVRVRK